MKLGICAAAALAACHAEPLVAPAPGSLVIDRFSDAAGHLIVRSKNPALPAPDQPIDLEHFPFVTRGLGPDGAVVEYYHFDVQRDRPATLFRLRRAGTHEVLGDVVDALPGDATYNDFWRIAWVDVPAGVDVRSAADIRAHQLAITPDPAIIDCPIVPRGTHARTAEPVELWYRGARVVCLRFGAPLAATADGRVPTSPIYVAFHGAGPDSGFEKAGPVQTHNVLFSVPGDSDYSPLWAVHIYDRSSFDSVRNEATALAAKILNPNGPLVNCPVITAPAPSP